MTSRKLVKLGKSSVVVSLPKDWLQEMALKPGDEVLLRKEFDGSLRVFPLKAERNILQPELIINIEECGEPEILEELLQGSYLTGREKIMIKSKEGFTGKQFKVIRSIVDKIRGLEIVEQSINEIVLKSFVDPTRFKISLLLKRMASLLTSMLEYFQRGVLDKQTDFIREINYIYEEIYRIYLIVTRQLIMCQINRDLLEAVELDNPLQLLEGRVIVNYLNDVGLELHILAKHTLTRLDSLNTNKKDVKETLHDVIKRTINIINDWLNNYIRKDLIALIKLYNEIDEGIQRINELFDYPWKIEVDEITNNWLKRTLLTFMHIKHLLKNAFEASINTYVIRPPVGCAVIQERDSSLGKVPH
ncbi:MAG: AbrB/MazE/SpoVT family DNA-binding domain-containing protein [Candidatus Njordarchaeia archaeon]